MIELAGEGDPQRAELPKYVFGPVRSRRLGQSLGVDPIPLKTCNWNCVYCQLGRTAPLVNTRKQYAPVDEILREVGQALAAQGPGTVDWVTFVGSGEPLLHSGIGSLIRGVKAQTSLPVAVITNGSLLYMEEVREELAQADAVLPALDAGTRQLYRRMNRPHSDIAFEWFLEGLVAFGEAYAGRLLLEVMLVRDLNDTEEALHDIARAVRRIQPDEVHINTPDRPPAECWVQVPDPEGLMRATAILGDAAHVVPPVENVTDLSDCSDVVEAVLSIIQRHPLSVSQLTYALAGRTPAEVVDALRDLRESGRARLVRRHDANFWTAASSHFPEQEPEDLKDELE